MPGGRVLYQVRKAPAEKLDEEAYISKQCSGTSKTYAITLEPLFCPCPAFSQQVLYLDAHVVVSAEKLA